MLGEVSKKWKKKKALDLFNYFGGGKVDPSIFSDLLGKIFLEESWVFVVCVCCVCVVCVLCVVFNLVVYVLQHYGKMERWKEVELKVKETNPIQQRETDPRLDSNIFSS